MKRTRQGTCSLVASFLAAVLTLVGGVAVGQANTTRTQVGAYAATAGVSPVVSAVVSTTTDWASHGAIQKAALDAAFRVVGASGKGAGVGVQVALPDPGPETVIQLKEYPLDSLPGNVKGLKFSFTMEILGAGTVENGIQHFSMPVRIVVTFPKGSDPFVLAKEKARRVFLKDMVKNPDLLDGFDGKVTAQGDTAYLIEVNAWRAGDPCCSG